MMTTIRDGKYAAIPDKENKPVGFGNNHLQGFKALVQVVSNYILMKYCALLRAIIFACFYRQVNTSKPFLTS